ncbi:MAG: polysaccharide biosynthesis tyrosine autokinase [Pseudomonadota bacterium]
MNTKSAAAEAQKLPSHVSGDDSLSLGKVLHVVSSARSVIVFWALLSGLAGALYAFTAPPIYIADALLQVEEQDASLGALELDEIIEGKTSVNTEIELLRSRSVLGDVVARLNLDIEIAPSYIPVFGAALARIRGQESVPVVEIDRLDLPQSMIGKHLQLEITAGNGFELLDAAGEQLAAGKVGALVGPSSPDKATVAIRVNAVRAEEGQVFDLQKRPFLASIEALRRGLSVAEKGSGSGILMVSLEGTDPRIASRNLNEIAQTYVRKNVEQKSAEAQQTLQFLEGQLPLVKEDTELAEAALNAYRLEKGSIDLPLETQAILETALDLEKQYGEIVLQREQALQRFTSAHPVIISFDNQIDNLAGQLAGVDGQVKELPGTQQEVLRLFRDVEVNTQMYTSLLNAIQEMNVVKAGTVGNVRIVDPAIEPYESAKPRRVMLVLLSLILGAFLGVAFALLRNALHRGVYDPEVVEEEFGLPVFAVIPHSGTEGKLERKRGPGTTMSSLLAVEQPSDMALESIRNIRTSLRFGGMNPTNNVILISGPGPGVGKSFVSANFAVVLANAGEKVLLVDGDLRKGSLHRQLGMQRKVGISQLASGDLALADAIQQTSIERLDFLANGVWPDTPLERVLGSDFRQSLLRLAAKYDRVIIDSPPALAVSDAMILGQLAGIAFVVLKAGAHPIREIAQCVRRLSRAKVNLCGFLFNHVDRSERNYGVGQYDYGYLPDTGSSA